MNKHAQSSGSSSRYLGENKKEEETKQKKTKNHFLKKEKKERKGHFTTVLLPISGFQRRKITSEGLLNKILSLTQMGHNLARE